MCWGWRSAMSDDERFKVQGSKFKVSRPNFEP
jgi:hypothetical protein